jgi:hypothetical protein
MFVFTSHEPSQLALHCTSHFALGSSTSHWLSQPTLQAPLQLAMQPALSLLAAQDAWQLPSQLARQSTAHSNLPGSTSHLPRQPASQSTLHCALGSSSQPAWHSTANFALHVARTLSGSHMVLHCALGGMTSHRALGCTSISPHAPISARAVAWLRQIKPTLSAAMRPSVTKIVCIKLLQQIG